MNPSGEERCPPGTAGRLRKMEGEARVEMGDGVKCPTSKVEGGEEWQMSKEGEGHPMSNFHGASQSPEKRGWRSLDRNHKPKGERRNNE